MDWTARIRGPKTIRETVPIFFVHRYRGRQREEESGEGSRCRMKL
jgi:hypothetical protein